MYTAWPLRDELEMKQAALTIAGDRLCSTSLVRAAQTRCSRVDLSSRGKCVCKLLCPFMMRAACYACREAAWAACSKLQEYLGEHKMPNDAVQPFAACRPGIRPGRTYARRFKLHIPMGISVTKCHMF